MSPAVDWIGPLRRSVYWSVVVATSAVFDYAQQRAEHEAVEHAQ